MEVPNGADCSFDGSPGTRGSSDGLRNSDGKQLLTVCSGSTAGSDGDERYLTCRRYLRERRVYEDAPSGRVQEHRTSVLVKHQYDCHLQGLHSRRQRG